MELTTASWNTPAAESAEETIAPQTGMTKVIVIALMLGLASATGYAFYSGAFDEKAGGSEQLKNLKLMLGMGPKAGATRFVAPVLGAVIVAVIALSVLAQGGRDVTQNKEQSKKAKQESAPKPTESKPTVQEEIEEPECNLASYKLFLKLKEESAEASANSTTVAAATSQTSNPVAAAH